MNTELHPASMQFVGVVNGELVAHTGVIQMPMKKGKKRIHRFVVLPDYQGIGIGTAFIDAVCRIVEQNGFEVNLTTTTPSLTHALRKSGKWILARFGRCKRNMDDFTAYSADKYGHLSKQNSQNRITYSFWHKRI